MPTNREFLEGIEEDFEKLKETSIIHFKELTEKQWIHKPGHEAWSVGQCIGHIVRTNELYLENINAAILRDRGEEATLKEYRSGFMGKQFFKVVDPFSKKKYKTFKSMEPPANNSPERGMEAFIKSQNQLIQLIRDSKEKDIQKIKVSSPIFSAIRFRLGDAFKILVLHEKRHLLQAQGILNSINFPT